MIKKKSNIIAKLCDNTVCDTKETLDNLAYDRATILLKNREYNNMLSLV